MRFVCMNARYTSCNDLLSMLLRFGFAIQSMLHQQAFSTTVLQVPSYGLLYTWCIPIKFPLPGFYRKYSNSRRLEVTGIYSHWSSKYAAVMIDNDRIGHIGANWLELPRLGSWQPTRGGGLGDLRSPEAAGQVGCCRSNDIVTI